MSMIPWGLLRPFVAPMQSIGVSMERMGRSMVPKHWIPYYPASFGIVLNEGESLKPLNYGSLVALNLAHELVEPSEMRRLKEDFAGTPLALPDSILGRVFIAPNTSIGKGVAIEAGSTVWYGAKLSEGVKIGENSHVLDMVSLGKNVKLGKDVTILAGAVVEEGVSVPNGCFVEAGVVVKSGASLFENAHVSYGEVVANTTEKQLEVSKNLSESTGIKSREQRMKEMIFESAFSEHKRESERTLSELLSLREDIAGEFVDLEEVLELGSSKRLDEERKELAKNSQYDIPADERHIFLTRRI